MEKTYARTLVWLLIALKLRSAGCITLSLLSESPTSNLRRSYAKRDTNSPLIDYLFWLNSVPIIFCFRFKRAQVPPNLVPLVQPSPRNEGRVLAPRDIAAQSEPVKRPSRQRSLPGWDVYFQPKPKGNLFVAWRSGSVALT